MDLGLHGKAAIVTGGNSGLGLAVARELAREGCDVCICARNEERLAAAKQEIQSVSEGVVRATRCDVSVAEDIAAVVEETVALFGTVHILVSNASVAPPSTSCDPTIVPRVHEGLRRGEQDAQRIFRECTFLIRVLEHRFELPLRARLPVVAGKSRAMIRLRLHEPLGTCLQVREDVRPEHPDCLQAEHIGESHLPAN